MSMHYPVFCYNGQFRRGADGTPLTLEEWVECD